MNNELKKAYDLLREKTKFDKVLTCIKLSDTKFLFFMDVEQENEDSSIDIVIDDGGIYEVDISNETVTPHYMSEYIEKDFSDMEQIDPEVFEMNKLFNL